MQIISIYKQYQKNSLGVYYTALAMIAIGLFISRAMLSIGFMIFVLNWFAEGDFKLKWQTAKRNKSGMVLSLIIVIHVIGMVHTQEFAYGLSDLKIKLPLILPLFFGSTPKLISSLKKNGLLKVFVFSAAGAAFMGFIRFEFFTADSSIEDLYLLSFKGQNIQIAVFAAYAISIIFYFLFLEKEKKSLFLTVIYILSAIWLLIYIYLLNSYTGYIVTFVLLIYSTFVLTNKINRKVFYFILAALISGILFLASYTFILIHEFAQTEQVDLVNLPKKTALGNDYTHNLENKRTENGYFVDLFVCRNELKENWEKKSQIPFEGKDKKGQELSETLIRYLTSKGLTKDASGIQQLSNKDIQCIENGCANYLYANKYSLKSRIYNIYWQIKTYHTTGNSTAQSISQRIDFLKASQKVIADNFWFGVGTGDVMKTFNLVLKETNPKLDSGYYNRVHNQYLVEFAALGIIGFLAFILIIFYPVFKFKIWKNYLLSAFYLVVLLAFFTDNPLETQLGVSFFAFFYTLNVFPLAMDTNKPSVKN